MKIKIISLFILAILIFCREASTDTLYLKNGNQYKGYVIRQDDEKVNFNIGEADDRVDVTFFNDEILRIDKAEVSSFISVPFGEGQNIDIPRPIFKQQPVVSEQVQVQKEQKAKSTSLQGSKDSDVVELEIIRPGKVEAEEKQAEPTEEQLKAETQREEPTQEEEPIQAREPADANAEPSPQVVSMGKDMVFQASKITKELSALLDEKERLYFLRINALVQGVTSTMANVLSKSAALNQQSDSLKSLVKEMPGKIDNIIAQIQSLEVPPLFTNFHSLYLNNLNLMKEVFGDLSQGDVAAYQPKMQSLQDSATQLQEELSRILAQKRQGL